jgi:hypothetical protein
MRLAPSSLGAVRQASVPQNNNNDRRGRGRGAHSGAAPGVFLQVSERSEKRESLDEDEKYIRATKKLTLFSIFWLAGSLASPLLHIKMRTISLRFRSAQVPAGADRERVRLHRLPAAVQDLGGQEGQLRLQRGGEERVLRAG